MRLPEFIRHIYSSAKKISIFSYVFWVTLLFYALLWNVNPGNKVVLALSVLLLCVFWARIRFLADSIIITGVAIGIILTGKNYNITLIPPGMFPIDFWPNGYIYRLTFTPEFLISLLLFIPLLKNFLFEKLGRVSVTGSDIFLLLYVAWTTISNLFISSRPDVSVLGTIFFLPVLMEYLLLRVSPRRLKLQKLFASVFCALLLVEGALAIQQFIYASPVGLSIETQQHIELFGEASDEIPFRYRPTGTFGHANSLAESLSHWLLYIAPAAFMTPASWEIGSIVIGLVTLGLTLSRASWVGTAVAGIFLFTKKAVRFRPRVSRPAGALILAAGLGLFLFAILPRLQASLTTFSDTGGAYVRELEFRTSAQLLLSHPLFGVGSGMSVPESLSIDETGIFKQFPTPIHNAYVLMAVEGGIPALLFFGCFVCASVLEILRRGGMKMPYVIGGVSALLALSTEAFFQPYGIAGTVIILLALITPYDTKIHSSAS